MVQKRLNNAEKTEKNQEKPGIIDSRKTHQIDYRKINLTMKNQIDYENQINYGKSN